MLVPFPGEWLLSVTDGLSSCAVHKCCVVNENVDAISKENTHPQKNKKGVGEWGGRIGPA